MRCGTSRFGGSIVNSSFDRIHDESTEDGALENSKLKTETVGGTKQLPAKLQGVYFRRKRRTKYWRRMIMRKLSACEKASSSDLRLWFIARMPRNGSTFLVLRLTCVHGFSIESTASEPASQAAPKKLK